MTSQIPLQFEDEPEELQSHLEITVDGDMVSVLWPPVGEALRYPCAVPEHAEWPDLEQVLIHTPSFQTHGMFGYTIGNFSEFFVVTLPGRGPDTAVAMVAATEITLGQVTPLGIHLFDNHHEEGFHPYWHDLSFLRVLGQPAENAEAYFLCGLALLEMEADLRLEPVSFDQPDWIESNWEERQKAQHQSLEMPRAILDIEPLRLFRMGLVEADTASAFLQFYRVLEFYAVLQLQDVVTELRWNRDLPAREFLKKTSALIDRDDGASSVRFWRGSQT